MIKIRCLNCKKEEAQDEINLDYWQCYCGSDLFEVIEDDEE